MATPRAYTARADAMLPDFCSARCVLRVLLLGEAVAVVVALGAGTGDAGLLERLFLLTVYVQAIAACSAVLLCLARRYAWRLGVAGLAALGYAVVLATTLAIAELAYRVGTWRSVALWMPAGSQAQFLLRSLVIGALVGAAGLRYLWLRAAWRAQVAAETSARIDALAARIEPHFLFNTLNSIASLIAIRPADAEYAVEDLAATLRARLAADTPDLIPLDEELALVKAYARIEKLRLGDRLEMVWRIAANTRACPVPKLCLQPLVENAVGHGVARLAAGGRVTVSAWRAGDSLCLRVTNPLAGRAACQTGNRQALGIIEQRLALRYGNTAQLMTVHDDTDFRVDLVLPATGCGAA